MFDIKENLKQLPDSPGVYLHKDKLGQIIYVGKAISLRNRVRQYFQSSKNMDPKVRAMVENIEEFEYITCATEMEALILECNLIKKYMPKYNVLLRDDKTYPFIKLTMNEEFPRILKVRRVEHDNCKYFGPYTDQGAVTQIVDLLGTIYGLKQCSAKSFSEGFRPCLNYHIHKCKGICTGKVDRQTYGKDIVAVTEFLSGQHKAVLEFLAMKMNEASEAMDFERAAEYRDYILAVNAVSEKQRVVMPGAKDMDVVMSLGGQRSSHVVVFSVRDGKLSGRDTYTMKAQAENEESELIGAFIKQHYTEGASVPKEILLNVPVDDMDLLEEFLSEIRGNLVKILVPQKGDKKALLELARKNIIEMRKSIDERENNQRERIQALGCEIHRIIGEIKGDVTDYGGRQYRLEAYDISNTNGVDTVGAMVVFEGLKAIKKDYRRFKVKTVEGPNDYGSLQEVIYRRFKRAQENDPGFSNWPDLLLIDGGKNQVSVVCQVLSAMKIQIPVAGMAKDDHHRTRALIYMKNSFAQKMKGDSEDYMELALKDCPLLFKYVGTVQEEVHRFAIEYHRGLRNKTMQVSALDQIPGIGKARRNALLAYFGSIEKIKGATVEELWALPEIPEALAKKIHEYFN